MTSITWTHPSVRALLREEGGTDPYAAIEQRARDLVLKAMEDGWSGPPYDPFELADAMGVEVVARQDVEDARLVPEVENRPRVEFNPNRRSARIRFSVAHELGHMLFADHGKRVQYRQRSHGIQSRNDDWQLEVLCNIAAAELLMPVGAFPMSEAADLSLPHLLDLRQTFGVSTEALLRRVVKLTDRSVCLFAAARLGDEEGFRLDYLVGSRGWRDGIEAGDRLPVDSVLSQCTAVGFSDERVEQWGGHDVLVQAVGIPPYPQHRFPRVVGLLQPAVDEGDRTQGLRYLRGDASQPSADGPAIVAHVVNDKAERWGGRGFAVSLMDRFPEARDDYADWAKDRARRQLGALHRFEVKPQLWVASLVAQSGYGDTQSSRPRLRLSALRSCLQRLGEVAQELQATVHIPPIGTGQGGTAWPPIRDLLLEELADRQVSVTVYVLPDAPMPQDSESATQLKLV